MSKLFSKRSKAVLGIVAVVYVLFTAYYVYSLVKWGGKRRLEEVQKNYVATDSAVYTVNDIELPERVVDGVTRRPRIVPAGTLVDQFLMADLMAAQATDDPAAEELEKGIEIHGTGSPIGMNATAIYQGLNFLVLVAVLGALVWKPTIEMLDERAETIRTDLATAADDRKDAEQLKGKYEGMLDEGRQKRSELIAAGEEAGKTEAERLRRQAEEEADRIRHKAQEEAEALENQTREKLVAELEQLSRELSEKVLRREVTMEDHHKMVDHFLNDIRKAPKA